MKLVRFLGLMLVVVFAMALLVACGDDEKTNGDGAATATRAAASPTGGGGGGGEPFFLEIAAENTEYDLSKLTAPAGEDITLQFDNDDDASTQHNWSLYENEEATTAIFEGEIITGGETIDYDVPAIDEPGTYHFHCDIHPAVMTGELIIE